MAAYNRRWYILSSIIGMFGIALLGASLGTQDFITMDLIQDTTNQCDQKESRKFGLFSGTDQVCLLTSEEGKLTIVKDWPVLCGDPNQFCARNFDSDKYPRLCECKYSNGEIDSSSTVYDLGLHWSIFGTILLSGLFAIYASATSFYNGITKPTEAYLSVRAVLYSYIIAIGFNIVGIILSVVYFFIIFNSDDKCPMIDDVAYLPEVPTTNQGYSCSGSSFGFSFYLELAGLLCFCFSILAAFMGQRGFQSIDETSKIDQDTKVKDVGTYGETAILF